jgi:PAS domain S-box-containing protein
MVRNQEELYLDLGPALFQLNAFGACEVRLIDCSVLRVNDALCDMTGYRRNEILFRSFTDLVHPVDRDEHLPSFKNLATGNDHDWSRRMRLVGKDGSVIWTQLHAARVRGEAESAVVAIHDVTESELNHAALRATEAQYRAVVESQFELICRFLPDTTLTFVNDAYCRAFGRTRDELIGTKFTALIPEASRAFALDHIRSLEASDRQEISEHEVHGADGTIRWQQWEDHAIRDADGAIVEFQSIGRDITDRKQTERKLRESQRRYVRATAAGRVALCEYDLARHEFYIDTALGYVLGLTNPPVTLRGWMHRIHPDDLAETRRFLRAALAPDLPRDADGNSALPELTLRLRTSDGRWPWFRVRASRLASADGATERYVGTLIEITEQKVAEDALRNLTRRLLKLQDDERRRISRELHDVTGQELFALTVDAERVRTELGPDISERVDDLLKEIVSLGDQVLREVRTLSYVLHPPMLDESGLAAAVRWYVNGFTERSGIAIELDALEDVGRLPPSIETAYFRIVQEALANVQRHSGSPDARITLSRSEHDVRMTISDHGTGIADGNEEIGETPFGVGIPGMRERVELLNGTLEIDSGTGGTVVTVLAPIKEAVR